MKLALQNLFQIFGIHLVNYDYKFRQVTIVVKCFAYIMIMVYMLYTGVSMNIYLIGYRCSGKTTIGNALAIKTGCSFLDTDEHITSCYNTTITKMVKKHGWQYFRTKEKEAIRDISRKNRYVVATGGGVILNRENIVLMKNSGVLIWLRAKKENIKNWILSDNKTLESRPSLTGDNIISDIEQTFNLRNDLYNSVCDFTVSVDKFYVSHICDRIFYFVPQILQSNKTYIN